MLLRSSRLPHVFRRRGIGESWNELVCTVAQCFVVQTRSAAVRVRELVSVRRPFFSSGSVGGKGDVFGQSRVDVSK
jgi:hypothetical protein